MTRIGHGFVHGKNTINNFPLDHEYNPAILPELLSCDAIHLSGGNTYHFLSALRLRSMMPLLQAYVDNGGIFIGVSAGAILATPTIHTAALCGDRNTQEIVDFSSLHLVSFAFLPHINHISNANEVVRSYTHQYNQPIITCKDGDGVIVQGNTVTFVGDSQVHEVDAKDIKRMQ